MTGPDQERLEALARANAELLRRVDELERRVALLEARPGQRAPAAPALPARAPGLAVATPPPLPAPPVGVPVAALPREKETVETRIGLTWVNRIAVFTCILAVAFFFKYAVDNNWIGPTGRVILGALAGLVSLVAGELLWRRGHHIYAQGLCGLGIAVLYLSFHASFSFYQLLPQGVAFALMVAVTVVAGAMSLRYASHAVASLGLFGGYATPALLSTGESRPWFLLSYVLLLDIGALAVARLRQWRALERLALMGTVFLSVRGVRIDEASRLPAGLFLGLYWFLFASVPSRLVMYVAHLSAGMAAVAVWDERPAGFVLVMLALTLGTLALGDRRNWAAAPLLALVTFAASDLLWVAEFTGEAPLPPQVIYLSLGFGMFLAWTPWRIAGRRAAATPIDLILVPLNAAFLFGRLYALMEGDYAAWRGLTAVGLAAVHLGVARFLWMRQPDEKPDSRPAMLLAGVALALLILACPIQFSGYRITMAWALVGAAAMWIAYRMKSTLLAAAGVVALCLTLVRLAVFDSWIYSSPQDYTAIANVRLLTFLVGGVSFLLASRWLFAGWHSTGALPVVIAGAGHATLLWGLGLEVLGWAARTASPENLRNLESASISILAAVYAVVLAGLGIATRTPVNRVFGLGLIGLIVLKLYVYDVWNLRLLYRVLAFAGLGGLLLLLSFLYSRYRSSIEALWQAEPPRGDESE